MIRQQVEKESLVGTLFCPTTPEPLPAVIVLGGSDGGLREDGAEELAKEGFAALALAYFGIDPLPSELVEIPLEYFASAISWLKVQPAIDRDRIGVLGGSKGGELALLLGTTYPEDVKAVVAYVPSGVVWQGISYDRRTLREGPKSSWTHKGEPVPFLPYERPALKEMVKFAGFFLGRPTAFRPIYERALEDGAAVARATIPVEKINGPVMLISGTDDQMWPSSRLSEMVIERLRAHDHTFPYVHLRYEGAGHMITLPGTAPNDTTQVERFKLGGSQEANSHAIADSWEKMLSFLNNRLG